MIIGVGNDIVELSRIKKLLDRDVGRRFLERVLTEEELAIAEGKSARIYEYAAGRFAAKEAVSKALGCGIGEKVGFRDISVVPDELGKPVCRLSRWSLGALGLPTNTRIHVSISHSHTIVSAFAVVELPD
jgi:holo-[acyl-carrier protein] synthase